jgi:flagellar M-ring protein FliF
VQGLIQFIRTLGAARLAAMGAVTAALIGFFAFVILRVTAVPLVALYTDLSMEDSNGIIKELERQAITFQIKNDGAIIMVPQDKVTRLRMKLAEGGMPKGGGVGYEIFDKSDALGTTSFVQNINHLRALEGELARTIRSLDRVQAARVHLVIPERPLFSRDKTEPSASIVVKVRGALETQQVRAIRQLVASAVNGLKAQRVSIVDETGRLLADGTADDGTAPARFRAAAARADRIDRVVRGRIGARAGQRQRRLRLQPHHPDFRQIRPGRPGVAFEPDARGILRHGRRPGSRIGRQ